MLLPLLERFTELNRDLVPRVERSTYWVCKKRKERSDVADLGSAHRDRTSPSPANTVRGSYLPRGEIAMPAGCQANTPRSPVWAACFARFTGSPAVWDGAGSHLKTKTTKQGVYHEKADQ